MVLFSQVCVEEQVVLLLTVISEKNTVKKPVRTEIRAGGTFACYVIRTSSATVNSPTNPYLPCSIKYFSRTKSFTFSATPPIQTVKARKTQIV